MKYLKRFFLLFFALVLLTTGLFLPASAAAVGDYIYLNSSDTTYTINVSNCNTWMDIPSDQGSFTLSWDASGYMFCKPKSSASQYIIVDDAGGPISYNMEIDSSAYSLCYVLEFDITETDAAGNRLLTYYFKETFSGNRTIGSLAASRVAFYNVSLGVCQFVHEGNGKYVFGINKQKDGSFSQRWYLVSRFENGKPVIQSAFDYTLTNGHYYGVDPCALGDHLLGEFITVRAATCAREGAKVAYCKYCQASVEKSIPRTEHAYIAGVCPCGEIWIVPGDQSDPNYNPSVSETNPPSSPDNTPTDPSDTPSEEDASEPGFWDHLKNWGKDAADGLKAGWDKLISSITGGGADNGGGGSNDGGAGGGYGNWLQWFLDYTGLSDFGKKMGSFFKTIMAIGGICLVIGFWPKISKFFKWVGRGFAAIWKSIKKFFKSFTKKRKKK